MNRANNHLICHLPFSLPVYFIEHFSHFCIPAEEFDVGREIIEEAYEKQRRGDIQLEPKASIQ